MQSCRPKSHGVTQADRQHAAPGGRTLLPAWNPPSGSDSPSARYPPPGAPAIQVMTGPAIQILPCRKFSAPHHHSDFPPSRKNPDPGRRPGSPLPSATSAGRFLWVESHSDVFATWRWACEAVKTANCLRAYLPAVFAVQRSHALRHVKHGRG